MLTSLETPSLPKIWSVKWGGGGYPQIVLDQKTCVFRQQKPLSPLEDFFRGKVCKGGRGGAVSRKSNKYLGNQAIYALYLKTFCIESFAIHLYPNSICFFCLWLSPIVVCHNESQKCIKGFLNKLYKSTNQPWLSPQSLFQVRVSNSLEPSPTENQLAYGKLLGNFRKEKSRSFGRCSNKYVSFDFPSNFAFGQFFVILKSERTEIPELPEKPEIKMYGDQHEAFIEGNFFNSLGPLLLFQILRTFP